MAINIQEAYRIPNRDHRFRGEEDTTAVPTPGVSGISSTQAHRNSIRTVAGVLSSVSVQCPEQNLGKTHQQAQQHPEEVQLTGIFTCPGSQDPRIPEAWLRQDLRVPEAA